MKDGDEVIRWMISAVIITILVLVVLNAFQDQDSMHEHHDFFDEVRGFMNRGGRNTEQQGYDLCKRTNVLEQKKNIAESNCEEIYPTARHYD